MLMQNQHVFKLNNRNHIQTNFQDFSRTFRLCLCFRTSAGLKNVQVFKTRWTLTMTESK